MREALLVLSQVQPALSDGVRVFSTGALAPRTVSANHIREAL